METNSHNCTISVLLLLKMDRFYKSNFLSSKNCVDNFTLKSFFLLFFLMMPFSVGTINVKGLRSPGKHTNLANFFESNNLSLCFVQETHYVEATDSDWKKHYPGKSLWAGSGFHSAGVGIIFRRGDDVDIGSVTPDPDGRYLIVSCTINKIPYTLINIYCPDRPSRRTPFLSALIATLESMVLSGRVILGGDFNFVLDTINDRSGGTPVSYHSQGKTTLLPFLSNHNLTDVWSKSKSNYKFTFFSVDGSVASRLDRFYVDSLTLSAVSLVLTEPVYFTDHKAVIFTLGDDEVRTSLWKLNTSILQEPEFHDRIRGFWECWQLERPAYPDLSLWWDLGKSAIKEISIQYCRQRSVRTRRQIRQLHIKIAEELNKTPLSISLLSSLKSQLQFLLDGNHAGSPIRAGVELGEVFELPNSYFYRMETTRKQSKIISKLKINEVVTSDPALISEHIANTYKDIFIKLKLILLSLMNYLNALIMY